MGPGLGSRFFALLFPLIVVNCLCEENNFSFLDLHRKGLSPPVHLFFNPSIPAPLRRFYVLCLGSCAGNLAGVLANATIHGLSLPTLFCFCCMLAVFALSAFGCVTRRCQPACYALLFVLVFVEFPALYYIYGAPTTPYLILGIVGLAIFIPHQQAALLATLAFAWDLFVMSMAHLFPAQLEPVTADAAFSSALCTFTIVAFCLFAITVLLNVQQERQAARLTQLSAQLEHAADHDPLTQLYNRRYLGRYLEGLLKEKAPFYLALLDLDWFKQINDKYGHAFGDQVLVEFARILSRCVAGHGIAVRFGGEEFMLVLSDCSQQRAMELLEQVRQDFLSFSQREKQTNFTFSCGLEYRGQAADLSDLYRAADHKLYQAKRSGRDAVVFFETAPAL